jgi:hypothetical protein
MAKKLLTGEVWTNSKNWNRNLMFTSNDGKHEGRVYGCPEKIAVLGTTALYVHVTKKGDIFYYHSEG